jgi:hypothetical protein
MISGGVSILQYADGTILITEHDLVKAINMKQILCIFQLEQEEGTIVGEDNLKVYTTEYYKKIVW